MSTQESTVTPFPIQSLGGKARAKNLSAAQRSKIAKAAAEGRWSKKTEFTPIPKGAWSGKLKTLQESLAKWPTRYRAEFDTILTTLRIQMGLYGLAGEQALVFLYIEKMAAKEATGIEKKREPEKTQKSSTHRVVRKHDSKAVSKDHR